MIKSIVRFLLSSILFCALLACGAKKRGYTVQNQDDKELNTRGIYKVNANDSKAQFLFIKAEAYYINKEYDKTIILLDEVIEMKPNQAAPYYKKANSLERKGEVSSAINFANTAVEKNPKGEEYALYLISLYKKTNNLQQAVFTYQNLIDQTQIYKHYLGQSEIYTLLAVQEVKKKENWIANKKDLNDPEYRNIEDKILKFYRSSLNSMNKYEEKVGVREDVLKTKQQIYLYIGDYKGAYEEGLRLMALMPREIKHKLIQADVIMYYKSMTEAIIYMKDIVNQFPYSLQAHLKLAEYYKRNNQLELYKTYLDAAFALPEVDVTEKVQLINQILTKGYTSESIETGLHLALKTREAHPNSPLSHSILGDAYYANRQNENARNSFVKALQLDEFRPKIWLEVLRLDEQLNQLDSLEKHAAKALVALPEETNIYLILADVKIKKKLYKEAISILSVGLGQIDGNSMKGFGFYTRLGDIYFTLKQYSNSYDYCEKALELDPNNFIVKNNYSYYIAEGGGDLDLAYAMMSQLVRLFPDDLNFLNTYGWVLFKKGDFVGAFNSLTIAAQLGTGEALEHAGDASYKVNKTNLALDYWKRAQATGEASNKIQQKINENKIP